MRGKSKIVLLLVLLLAVVGVAGLALFVPFTTDSAVKGYEYRVNTLRVNWYLLANGYSKQHSGVKIDLVEMPQSGYRLTGKEGKVLQSVAATSEGETLVMQVQYDPVQRENYARSKGGSTYSRDLYMYLCLAMQGDNPTPSDCYERADLQIARERWLPGATVQMMRQDDVGWRLVPRVHAQACAGMIACGGWTNQGQCSISGAVCDSSDDCGKTGGSCVASGTQTCDTSLNPINCKSLTNQNSCKTQGYVRNCNIGCNTSAENFCSWGGSGYFFGSSVLAKVEISAAFQKAVRMNIVSAAGAKEIWSDFLSHWQSFTRLRVTDGTIERASDIAWKYGLRGCDSLHLAAAMFWQETLGMQVFFAAFDRDLQRVSRLTGLEVWLPD